MLLKESRMGVFSSVFAFRLSLPTNQDRGSQASRHASSVAEIVSLILEYRWAAYRSQLYEPAWELGLDYPTQYDGEVISKTRYQDSFLDSILVSRIWAEEGLRILWRENARICTEVQRHAKGPNYLAITPERRQLYAPKLQSLHLDLHHLGFQSHDEPKEIEAALSRSFPALQELYVHVNSGLAKSAKELEILTMQVLGQKVTKLKLLENMPGFTVDGNLPPMYLKRIQPYLTNLTSLDVSRLLPSYVKEFRTFIEQTPSITELHIKCHQYRTILSSYSSNFPSGEEVLTEQINNLLRHLMYRPNLKSLSLAMLPNDRRPDGWEQPTIPLNPELLIIDDTTQSPFPKLQNLVLCGDPLDIASFCSTTPNLRSLHIPYFRSSRNNTTHLDIYLGDILDKVSSAYHLESLTIDYNIWDPQTPRALTGSSLVHLARNCPSLRHLHLAPGDEQIFAPDLCDSDIEVFSQLVPNLETLSLGLDPEVLPSLSTKAFLSLGRNCPRLTSLRIKANFDMSTLSLTEAPIFPALQTLGVFSFSCNPEPQVNLTRAQQFLKTLRHHFPRLIQVQLWAEQQAGASAVRVYKPPWNRLAEDLFENGVERREKLVRERLETLQRQRRVREERERAVQQPKKKFGIVRRSTASLRLWRSNSQSINSVKSS
ncbi:hypothetical protein NA57DRAFT_55080 [Rhizodiscina lignyota]|uniref:Uncharacterized protein n=1 Tax=Rhizodiscina lignyota TaxID=1504668 RepID=A0A9P4IKJ2_9PEZI|nr:hypothetical protein NA57DRAFT_55080 [Rhizodiscina lignyota]